MKVIKNINNNISLCVDSKGRQLIAFGKGIGFIKPPYEVHLEMIERTFYNASDIDYEAIKDIPTDVLKAAIKIVDLAENNLGVSLLSTTALALADHIHFAIQREQAQLTVPLPIQEDLKQLHAKEMQIAAQSLDIIAKETGFRLSQNEVSLIALHLVNNQVAKQDAKPEMEKYILDDATAVIEEEYGFTINKDNFNYSRFATHLYYLVNRIYNNEMIATVNAKMFEEMKRQYPKAVSCASKVSTLLEDRLKQKLSDEEKLYLILHINRLCSREEQSQ